MAKGDAVRARNEIKYQGARGAQLGENLRTGTLEPQLEMFRNYYQNAANRQVGDYGDIMGKYGDFAKTGGYSPGDLSNIRSRALSPTRAVYDRAQQNVNRQRSLQGGYSPGFGTLQSRMAREQGQGLSDAATNAEAGIAQMVQQGKLAGLAGQAGMYGTTPGMANMFGNQVLQGTNQLTAGVGNEMDFGQRQAQQYIDAARIPSSTDVALNRAGQIADIGRNIFRPQVIR